MHQIPKLNKKELRNFGLLSGAVVVVLFGLLLPWLRGHAPTPWPWAIAAVLWCLAILAPMRLKPVFQLWMRIGLVIGWIETRIILGIVFYGIIMPMGIIMRLLHRDPMARKFETHLQTYRLLSQPKSKAAMEKPF
jgi:hypothetical protein